jgi:glycerophosphoryl diester phosphodiesterase
MRAPEQAAAGGWSPALSRRVFVASAAVTLMSTTVRAQPALKSGPIIIGHRGASADRPEHTLEAYAQAIAQGADYIEPDLVMTKDGVLIARHENEIGSTTDVARRKQFASRRKTKLIDGISFTGWFTEDFTLAEIKSLRAIERLPLIRPLNSDYDGQFEVPTFDEVIALAARESARLGRRIGLYPETKHPGHHHKTGLPQEASLLASLQKGGYGAADDPVFIQSFETFNLKALNGRCPHRLIQLIEAGGGPSDMPATRYRDMLTPAGLEAIAGYAQGIGVAKSLIATADGDAPGQLAFTSLIADAHAAGLLVHGWTFRPEPLFLLAPAAPTHPEGPGDSIGEVAALLRAGLDGAFCDRPADGVAALETLANSG